MEQQMGDFSEIQASIRMPKTLNIIRDEHRSIAAILHGMEYLVQRIRARRKKVDPRVFHAMLYYLDTFSERMHHPKEDQYLFKAMRERSAEADAHIADLEEDHAGTTCARRKTSCFRWRSGCSARRTGKRSTAPLKKTAIHSRTSATPGISGSCSTASSTWPRRRSASGRRHSVKILHRSVPLSIVLVFAIDLDQTGHVAARTE
jgi:chemotaxis protein histidine kinase CheA